MKYRVLWMSLVAVAFATGGVSVRAQAAAATPEFGRVAWGRDFDAALARAKASTKPIALLFQEVPG